MATLRCFVIPAPGPLGDLSYHYLVALREAAPFSEHEVSVRAISVAGGVPGIGNEWGELASLFATPITNPFVNVVISLPGYIMGTTLVAGPLGITTGMDASADGELGPNLVDEENGRLGVDGAPVYEATTAFRGLHTADVVNIAITSVGMARRGAMTIEETTAILGYDYVLCPSEGDVAALHAAAELLESHAVVLHMHPHEHQAKLALFIDELIGGL